MPYVDPVANKIAKQRYYHKNTEKVKKRSRDARQRAKDHITAIRAKSQCIKCGENHPATLDFHHRDPAEKDVGIANMIRRHFSIAKIDDELSKCDVVCSNCHRIIHWEWAQQGIGDELDNSST